MAKNSLLNSKFIKFPGGGLLDFSYGLFNPPLPYFCLPDNSFLEHSGTSKFRNKALDISLHYSDNTVCGRYLNCVNPRCKVRGSIEMYDGAPIRLSKHSVHNHQPDLKRWHYLLLVNRCKFRAINEDTPIAQIYEEETSKWVPCGKRSTSLI